MNGRKRRGVRLEMTPLMDIMFLVLVFFIYCIAEMSVHRGVRVDLPAASGSPEHGERVVLTIAADDSLSLNGRTMPRDEIVRRVRELTAAQIRILVLISGDRKSSLGVGVGLLAELRSAGVEKVSFQVDGK